MENRSEMEDDRASTLEAKLREAQSLLQETETKYEEVVSKIRSQCRSVVHR